LFEPNAGRFLGGTEMASISLDGGRAHDLGSESRIEAGDRVPISGARWEGRSQQCVSFELQEKDSLWATWKGPRRAVSRGSKLLSAYVGGWCQVGVLTAGFSASTWFGAVRYWRSDFQVMMINWFANRQAPLQSRRLAQLRIADVCKYILTSAARTWCTMYIGHSAQQP
jgi:hypothetical protein